MDPEGEQGFVDGFGLSFTGHGLERADGSRGRYYPSTVISDAICNPIAVLPGRDGATIFEGIGLTVIVSSSDQIITMY